MTRPASGQLWPRTLIPRGGDAAQTLRKATAADYALEWGAGGGGAGGFPNEPPAFPHAFDDEFTGGALGAKWTEIANPTATGFVKTFAKYGTWLALPNPGAASNHIWDIRQALSGFGAGTAFQVTFRLGIRGWNGGTNGRATVSLSNNSAFEGGSFVNCNISSNAGGARIEVFDGAFDAQSDLGYPAAHAVFFHFQRNASNVARIWVSLDGFGWRLINTETRNWDASFCFVRLIGHNVASNPTEPMIDWVRFNDTRFTMPVP